MAIKHLTFSSPTFIPIAPGCCPEVYMCLTATPWADRTLSGYPLVKGTIENSGRFLGSASYPFAPRFENPRCEGDYQYSISYDDSQLVINPGTGFPWEVDCASILDVMPYTCTIDALISAIGSGGGGGGGGAVLYTEVTDPAHGFSLPSFGVLPVKYGVGGFELAQADSTANSADTLVVSIPGVNTLRLQNHGPLTVPGHGLTVGHWYVLDPDVPGNIISESALGPLDLLQYVLFVASTTQLILSVEPMDGVV